LTKQILNKFELISVRDKFSLSIINDLGLDIPVILSADPAVMLNPESPTTMTNIIFPQSPYIILSIRKWFDYRSSLLPIKYLRKFELNENKRFLKSLDVFRKMCDWIIENYGFHIYFIPMYIENEQNDNDVAKRIKNGMAHANLAHVIDDQMPPRTLIRFMENAEFLIGMRMHSTILGACAGIPIIGLYYQHKGKCFFQSMGIENLMLSIEDVNQNDLSDMIDHVLTNKSSIVRKTTNNLSNQKSLVQTTVNRIGRQFFQSPHA
jgi:polysaccharide pyruvyl transferase WcaK-like protein